MPLLNNPEIVVLLAKKKSRTPLLFPTIVDLIFKCIGSSVLKMGIHGKEVPSKINFVLERERFRKFIYSEDRETPVELRSSFQLSCVESAILIFYMTF